MGKLIEVIITVCWKTRDKRIFGEDGSDGSIPDGVLNLATEDKNHNGEMDSPVQLRVLLSDKNLPMKKIFLGRPE